MKKNIGIAFLLILTFTSFTFGQSKSASKDSTSLFMTPKNMTPLGFIEALKPKDNLESKLGLVTMIDSFPSNWLTKKDIDTLIKLVNSKEKYNCLKNPFSSYIPINDSADLGGYAIWLIKAYKENISVSFGLHFCPKSNKEDADELIRWWTKQNK